MHRTTNPTAAPAIAIYFISMVTHFLFLFDEERFGAVWALCILGDYDRNYLQIRGFVSHRMRYARVNMTRTAHVQMLRPPNQQVPVSPTHHITYLLCCLMTNLLPFNVYAPCSLCFFTVIKVIAARKSQASNDACMEDLCVHKRCVWRIYSQEVNRVRDYGITCLPIRTQSDPLRNGSVI